MNSSETSAKYSWPSNEQKEAIQDSGGPEEVDILSWQGGWEGGACLLGLGGWSADAWVRTAIATAAWMRAV